jgi:hypothetical protein
VIEDLGRCPEWLSFVLSAQPAAAAQGDPGPAWQVDLGARVGPIRRSKRVRMVRATPVEGNRDGEVRFERCEVDGRPHSEWVLTVVLEPAADGGTDVTGELLYGGRAWLPGLDVLVARELRAAGSRLAALLRAG